METGQGLYWAVEPKGGEKKLHAVPTTHLSQFSMSEQVQGQRPRVSHFSFSCLENFVIYVCYTRILKIHPLHGDSSPIEWVPGALSPWIKLPLREDDHSLPSLAEVKNNGATPPVHLDSMVLNYILLPLLFGSRSSAVGIATCWEAGGVKNFLLST
jgi:hypothetical protein